MADSGRLEVQIIKALKRFQTPSVAKRDTDKDWHTRCLLHWGPKCYVALQLALLLLIGDMCALSYQVSCWATTAGTVMANCIKLPHASTTCKITPYTIRKNEQSTTNMTTVRIYCWETFSGILVWLAHLALAIHVGWGGRACWGVRGACIPDGMLGWAF